MLIAGTTLSHDTGVALLNHGAPAVIAEAERVCDVKHAQGYPAIQASAIAAFRETGMHPGSVDAIAIDDYPESYFFKSFHPQMDEALYAGDFVFPIGPLSATRTRHAHLPIPGVRPDTPVYAVCHTIAHAAHGLYASGFESCAILVTDGYGSTSGTQAFVYQDGRLRQLSHWRDRFLLGHRYGAFGYLLREIDTRDRDRSYLDLAGKVMGLHAYGRPDTALTARFRNWYHAGPQEYFRYKEEPLAEMVREGGFQHDSLSVHDPDSLTLVASLQQAFTEVMVEAVADLVRETGLRRVVLVGGCGLNVVANQQIARDLDLEALFIPPNCGDSGIPLGAAILVDSALTGTPLHHPDVPVALRRSPYLGLSLQSRPWEIDWPDALSLSAFDLGEQANVRRLAEWLTQGHIIGLACGRSEVGPRALGNRSLLASPSKLAMKDRINHTIKHREWWRPFAPVCRRVDADRYFDLPQHDPYMIIGGQVRAEYQDRLQAITHVDGSARVQTLPDRDSHPVLWDLLTATEELTGIGVLLNTSFNEGGRPLLNSSEAVARMLMKTGLTAACVDGYLVHKAGPA